MKKLKKRTSVLLLIALFLGACNNGSKQNKIVLDKSTIKSESQALLNFFESNGDFINSRAVPTLIEPENVFENLDKYLVIDLRSNSDYVNGHIDNAINIPAKELLNYLEKTESAAAYEKVVLVSYSSQTASYSTSILRLLGYGNIYSMKWGMSSWNKLTAGDWSKNISNKYAFKLEKKENAKPQKRNLPELKTGKNSVEKILYAQADTLLKLGLKRAKIKVDNVWAHPENYFIMNYWPKAIYDLGHIPGALQYTPKKSLSSKAYLLTLPTDKPIVIYDYTGQHASFVTAYLRMLGYDAKILLYGANSFMNGKMRTDSRLGHAFNPNKTPKDFALNIGKKPHNKPKAVSDTTKLKKDSVKKRTIIVEDEDAC